LKKAIDIVPSGGPNLKLNMKDGRHYTFKAHTQEDFKKWGAAISQGIKNANSPVPEKKEVDVSFMDRSSLPIVIDPKKTTAEDVRGATPFPPLTLMARVLIPIRHNVVMVDGVRGP
jgi:hypothetical protein